MDLLSKRLLEWEEKLKNKHTEYVAISRSGDSQKAGHAAERIWFKLISEMLPPSYRVLLRPYMDSEVDLVVLPPSAPSFYDDAETIDIPNDVASAVIHVKNTIDRGELRDAMKRVHSLNNGLPRYNPSDKRELEGLPCAVVGLGCGWSGGFNSAIKSFRELIFEGSAPTHPGQIPGYVGTAEWDIFNHTVNMPGVIKGCELHYQKSGPEWDMPHIAKIISGRPSGKPIHSFVLWLYTACALSDPTIEPMRVALNGLFRITGAGTGIPFRRNNVYSASRQ